MMHGIAMHGQRNSFGGTWFRIFGGFRRIDATRNHQYNNKSFDSLRRLEDGVTQIPFDDRIRMADADSHILF